MVSLLSACSISAQSQFPEISGANQMGVVDQSTIRAIDPTAELGGNDSTPNPALITSPTTLRVAGPITSEHLKILGRYFELLQNDVSTIDAENMRGDQISLDWLNAYQADLQVQAIPLPLDQPIEAEQAAHWTKTNSWPDIIISKQLIDPKLGANLVDLNAFLANNPNYVATAFSPHVVNLVQETAGPFYLPWRFSYPVLYRDQTVLSRLDFDPKIVLSDWPAFTEQLNHVKAALIEKDQLMSKEILTTKSATIESTTGDPINKTLVLGQANRLLEFWPAYRNNQLGWSTWQNSQFHFNDPAVIEAASVLNTLQKEMITLSELDEQLYFAQSIEGNPIANHQVAYWIGQSSDLSGWRKILGDQVRFAPLPLQSGVGSARNPIEIVSISVSATSQNRDLAIQFAAFLAADANANLLQIRLSDLPGYFPVSQDPFIWAEVAQRHPDGDDIEKWPSLLNYTYTTGAYSRTDWATLNQAFFQKHADQLVQSTRPENILIQMQNQFEVQDG
ncbi:MAG: hypothetical protein PHC86_03445 [Eubacteriales bacterium]|nr:hypothetical protein [Eubacteriales bacterium]